MNDKLKPCPFCGGEAALIKDISGRHAWHGCCNNGKCFMSMGLPIWSKSEKEAAQAWNKRADTQPVDHGWWEPASRWMVEQCSVCEFEVGTVLAAKYSYCPNCGVKMDGEPRRRISL